MVARMHTEQVDIADESVRRALDRQFPHFATVPLRRLASDGTINAVFRLGARLVVRVPMIAWGSDDALREAEILPLIRGRMPIAVPELVAVGDASEDLGIPWKWSVLTWLDGERAYAASVPDPDAVADSYAGVLRALSAMAADDAPTSLAGGKVLDGEEATLGAIADARGLMDARELLRAWGVVREAPDAHNRRGAWVHGDPTPGNLLIEGGRLRAMIDWSSAGLGDTAHDLIVAWWLLPANARRRLRVGIDVDDETWARGRAFAFRKGLYALRYYAVSNPAFSADARFALEQIVEETGLDRPL